MYGKGVISISRKSTDKKLLRAVSAIADIVSKEAELMKNADEIDLKELKELTTAAKELAAISKALNSNDIDERCGIAVIFDSEEAKKWAM